MPQEVDRELGPAPVSALAIPITVPPVLARARDRWDPTGARAHVTVMYPFMPCPELRPAVREDLAEIARRIPAFQVRFERIRRFPDLVWIEPEPADPIAALTAAVTARWPDYQAYGGEFETVIPHLSVVESDDGPLDTIEALARVAVPFSARADRMELWCQDAAGQWRARWRIPLGLRR